MRDDHAAFEQQLLNVAVTQVKSIIEPDPMANNFAGKAVILVPFSVSRRGMSATFSGVRWVIEGTTAS